MYSQISMAKRSVMSEVKNDDSCGFYQSCRCLPCHLNTSAAESKITSSDWVKQGKYRPYYGCPYCTREIACRQVIYKAPNMTSVLGILTPLK
jgi:hypothetical protein